MVMWHQNFLNPGVIVFIGALLVAIGTLLGFYQQNQFEHVLRVKSEELAEAYNKIIPSITGGDGFCYVRAFKIEGRPAEKRWVVVTNPGNYPLYDVHLDILPLKKYQELKKALPGVDARIQAALQVDVGNLPAQTSKSLGDLQLPLEGDGGQIIINITARNGLVTEEWGMRHIGGKWVQAIRVTRKEADSKKMLYEDIPEQFPRDQVGNPQW